MPDYSYQTTGIEFLRNAGRGFLGDEPGLGKTMQAISAAEGRTLVIAPANVLDAGVWSDEVAKWRPDLDVTYVSYHGLAARKGHKMFPTLSPWLKEEHATRPFETLIADEAHYFKGRDTKWTKAVSALLTSRAKVTRPIERVYELSGTPIPNWAHELYIPLTHVRVEDNRPGGYLASYWRWIETYFRTTPSQYGGAFSKDIHGLLACTSACKLMKQCEHWKEFYRDAFTYQGKLIFLQRLRDDVLKDLPPLTLTQMNLPMAANQAKYYKALKKDFIIWLQAQDASVLTLEAWSKIGLFTKLMRCATGIDVAAYPERPAGPGLSNKLDLLTSLVADQAQPSLVVAHFRTTVALAAERLAILGLRVCTYTGDTPKAQRPQLIRDFQSGAYDCMIATIDTVKEGLTLTAADTVHRLERSWRPSSNVQVIRRCHRIGQTRPVNVIDYVSLDTTEQHQLQTLAAKTDEQVRALTKPELLELFS